MKKSAWWLSALCLLVFQPGCASPPNTSVYRSSDEEDSRFASAGVDELEYGRVCKTMVESMLEEDLRTSSGERPMIVLGEIKNATNHEIDTQGLAELIRVDLMKSRTVRFNTATSFAQKGGESGDIYKQLEYQNESGHCEPGTVKAYGQIVGADYVLFGRIFGVERTSGNRTQANFNFILNLYEVKTGELIWTDVAKITKVI